MEQRERDDYIMFGTTHEKVASFWEGRRAYMYIYVYMLVSVVYLSNKIEQRWHCGKKGRVDLMNESMH